MQGQQHHSMHGLNCVCHRRLPSAMRGSDAIARLRAREAQAPPAAPRALIISCTGNTTAEESSRTLAPQKVRN